MAMKIFSRGVQEPISDSKRSVKRFSSYFPVTRIFTRVNKIGHDVGEPCVE